MESVRTFTKVGVLRDLVGKGNNLGTTKENLAKPMDVGVKLALKDAKTGIVYDGFVSPALSVLLKTKQISLGALLDYPLSKDNEGNILLKMKHYWEYFAQSFDEGKRYYRMVKKADSVKAYYDVLNQIVKLEE